MFKQITTGADLPAPGTAYESETLDAKQHADPGHGFELAKDIAAFANRSGGRLLVGASEDGTTGLLTGYPGLPEKFARSVRDAYNVAAKDRCSPTPVVTPTIVDVPGGKVVVINVLPFPGSPVGVRAALERSEGKRIEGFVFPVRVGVLTEYVRLEHLAMYLEPASRKATILLDAIPSLERGSVVVMTDDNEFRAMQVGQVDVMQNHVVMVDASQSGRSPTYHVPLDAVREVWKDTAGKWVIRFAGRFLGGSGIPSFMVR